MSQTDAKNWLENRALLHEPLQVINQLFAQLGITRPIAQKQSVVFVLKSFFLTITFFAQKNEKLLFPQREASSTAPIPLGLIS
jgi:hypothetical protein